MKRELPYFTIEGSCGGNQNWFPDPMMRLGGCAAATACDTCIYLALHRNKKNLCPVGTSRMRKRDYVRFGMKMKSYLRPRRHGLNTLKLFADGFQEYLKDVGETGLFMDEFPGERPSEQAREVICRQIDGGLPIPVLLLKHRNPVFDDFVWHWFLIVGYEERENEFYVKVATYGKFYWMPLSELWNTGYEEKGGLILYRW